MPFKQRIRLPMQLHSAQFPEERTVFRKANGVSKTLSVIVRKTYELETDLLPEFWHQRLKIALAHDNISWEGERYLGDIVQDGDYTIQWPDGVLHYPAAKAECKVQVTPFDATNSNCMTCDEASQLNLVDDTVTGIYGALQEDTDYTWPVADNDTICCFPASFSAVYFNSNYIDSGSINASTGLLSFHTKPDLPSVNGMLIATYRVTCPNGGYDEANVYANIEGTLPGCAGPSNVIATGISSDEITFEWDAPGAGLFTYYWEIYEGTLPVGSPVQTGTLTMTSDTTMTVFSLTSGTDYYFQIKRVCIYDSSIFSGVATQTVVESETCGSYRIDFDNGSGIPSDYLIFNWRTCSTVMTGDIIYNNSSMLICASQFSPGIPVFIQALGSGAGMTITYLGIC
jgi:Fibronectin type III domain